MATPAVRLLSSGMGHRELLERAFALAQSGNIRSVKDIRVTLMREGFTYFDLGQLSGTTLSKQIAHTIASVKSQRSVRAS